MDASSLNLSQVTANDYNFAYRKTGTGPALILVHGNISDLRSWNAIVPLLSSHFTTYAYSRRYAWPNKPIDPQECPRWESDADDLTALINALNITPCYAVGNSSGGVTCILAAHKQPTLFHGICVEEPPVIGMLLSTPPTTFDILKFFLAHPISFWPVMYYAGTTLGPSAACANANPPDPLKTLYTFGPGVLSPRFWTLAISDPERKHQLEANADWLHNFFAYSAIPKFGRKEMLEVKGDVLVLTGDSGPWSQWCVDAEVARVLGLRQKGLGRTERGWVKGAGHLCHEDNPEAVAEALRVFFRV